MYKSKDMISEIRLVAKKNGLTFRNSKRTKINGVMAWVFVDRLTQKVVLSNCTLQSAYENCISGYIDSYDSAKSIFLRINCY